MKKSNEINKSLKFTDHEWIAACGHELRIPIAQIHSCSEILKMDLTDPFLNSDEREQYLNDLMTANKALEHLMEDLINNARSASHQFTVNNQAVDLQGLLNQVHHSFQSHTDNDVTLTLDYADDVPTTVIGDPQRIQQVLANLIRNALKFTASGTVAIKAEVNSEDNKLLKVSVTDTGIGMNAEQIQRIWDAFTKVHDEHLEQHKEINKGLGLGLAISSNLVNAMGGEIGVDSVPGKGSQFYFTLQLSGFLPTQE